MALRPALQLRQGQKLALTPGLKQSIEIMLVSAADLADLVGRRLEENPFLERTGSGGLARPVAADAGDSAARIAAPAPSLAAYLAQEARLAFDDAADLGMALALIAELDEAGYLPPGAVQEGVQEARVLKALQAIAPPGVFARSLSECLALQLADRGLLDPAWERLLAALPLVARGEQAQLLRATGLSAAALAERLKVLRGLDPKPGLSFAPPEVPPAIADLIVTLDARGRPEVHLNPEALPQLAVDRGRRRALAAGLRRAADKRYAAERLAEAGWLVRAIARRGESLLALGRALAQHQAPFLREGLLALRPLTRRTLARRLQLSEASVSRLVANKHIATPWGLLPLARLFSAGLRGEASAAQVTARLAQLIRGEPREAPLSDQALTRRLAGEGFAVARRTVAKYRISLSIPPAHQRRRQHRSGPSTRIGRQLDSLPHRN
ncbi:MAG TPA: RNA polymerase sigma-54 factor [Kiloniellales bacterium]|nr:RNA polymerase sigma-54 factor [Kiloniellales bacterium]